MRSLIRQAVARPVGVTIVYLALAVLGLVSLTRLSIDLLPDVDVPWVSITTRYEGVAPQEIETLITRPIEKATSSIENVEKIDATSSEGLSRVTLRFDWGTDLETALDDVRTALDRVRTVLPDDAEPPSLYKFDISDIPVMNLAVTGNEDPRRLKFLAEDDLSRALERLPGVASVNARGGRDREIRVALDAERLAALGLDSGSVEAALAKENRTVSAGDLEAAGKNVVVRTAGEFTSLRDIENTVVTTKNGEPVMVREIATVSDTIAEVNSELWLNRKPGIELSVHKQSGANTVDVANRVREEIARINERFEGRAHLNVMWDSSDYIVAAVTGVEMSAAIGGVLAIFVLLFFLRSIRATLVVATAIPISVLATFAVLFSQGMTLNVISFGGLALGIGILVDGAVVILESIHRKREERYEASEAAVEGTHEVATAVVAGTLTTLAVFAPIVFLEGFSGVLFGEMALVVTFALACALVVALTLVPMLAARLFGQAGSEDSKSQKPSRLGAVLERAFRRLEAGYGRFISASLAAPWAIVVAAVALCGATAVFAMNLDVEVAPESDEGRIDVDIEFPVGTTLETTRELILEAEERIVSEAVRPRELRHLMTSAGPEAWWRTTGSNEGEVDVMLVPAPERERSVTEVADAIRKSLEDLPGAKLRILPRSSNVLTRIIRGGEDRLSIQILGHDLERADHLADRVAKTVKDIPGITYARPDRELGRLERVLHVDRQRAAQLGLGSAEIAESVERYLLGRVATLYRDRGDEFDIRVVLDESQRENIQQLESLPVLAPSGERVPLGSLVTIEEKNAPSSIERLDQQRVMRVNAGISGRALDEVAKDLRARLNGLEVPSGFTIRVGGELGEQDETFRELIIGIFLALFLVYSVMAIQFESARHPLVIMVSVPFAMTGVVFSLLLTGTTLNVYSFLGAIVLVGIVVNNAIVLVDYTNLLRRRDGLELTDALVYAGKRRLRPILMTTSTTLLGLMPLAIGVSQGSETQTPLARALIGGLTTSTLVTLILVPAVYLLVERRRTSAKTGPQEATSRAASDSSKTIAAS